MQKLIYIYIYYEQKGRYCIRRIHNEEYIYIMNKKGGIVLDTFIMKKVYAKHFSFFYFFRWLHPYVFMGPNAN